MATAAAAAMLAAAALLLGGAQALVDSPRLVGQRAYDDMLPDSSPQRRGPSGGGDGAAQGPGNSDEEFPPPIIRTPLGQMQGSYMQSRRGRLIYAFRGIPYVQAPVGPLRFQPPQPAVAWDGVLNATADGPACPQENGYSFPTSEDCLFLNVYTTRLPSRRSNPRRPVFLYIHMGGWYGNNARSDNHGPQYLTDQDIVVVTFNYRLGALGFLSTGDGVLPGNYAMKDQVAAMRWVQQNILAFGGDPARVTLAGYSAGAAAVWFHLASPQSRGLFHQAIAMSMSINAQNDLTQDKRGPLTLARRQARASGCPQYETSQQIKDCLMALPAQQISGTLAAGEMFDWGIDPVLVYFPVLEPPGPDAFLTEDVAQLFQSGNFTQVPWITGRTRDEFDWRASTVFERPDLREDMTNNWDRVAPLAFMFAGEQNSDPISQRLHKFYLQDGPVTEEVVVQLGHAYSDSIIGFGEDRAAKTVAGASSAPVWFYEFDYQGRFSYQYRGNSTVPYGVMHQDDVMYMFYLAAIFPYFGPDAPEIPTVERLTQLWGNFVIHGHPTPKKDPLLDNVIWKPMTVDNLKYLKFGDRLEMRERLFQKRNVLWEELFPMKQQ